MFTVKRMIKSAKAVVPTARLKPPLLNTWTPQFLKQQNLTISADILNVLDSKTAVDTTNTGVATYASGRTFWLDVSMKF